MRELKPKLISILVLSILNPVMILRGSILMMGGPSALFSDIEEADATIVMMALIPSVLISFLIISIGVAVLQKNKANSPIIFSSLASFGVVGILMFMGLI